MGALFVKQTKKATPFLITTEEKAGRSHSIGLDLGAAAAPRSK